MCLKVSLIKVKLFIFHRPSIVDARDALFQGVCTYNIVNCKSTISTYLKSLKIGTGEGKKANASSNTFRSTSTSIVNGSGIDVVYRTNSLFLLKH